MTSPAIHLATVDDMRAITSQNLDAIKGLPHLYIATDEPSLMRVWGVADAASIGDYERLYPSGLLAPAFAGETASRGDLVYNGSSQRPTSSRAPETQKEPDPPRGQAGQET